jgi:hypothetical protein
MPANSREFPRFSRCRFSMLEKLPLLSRTIAIMAIERCHETPRLLGYYRSRPMASNLRI